MLDKLGFLNPGGGPEQFVGGRKISGDRCAFRLLDKMLNVAFFRHAFSVRRFDLFRNAALLKSGSGLRLRTGCLTSGLVE